jgi:hypothetical protein
MREDRQNSVGAEQGQAEQADAGVPQRWLTLWARESGDQPALLDAAFIRKSLEHGSHDGPQDGGTGRLPQG